MADDRSNNATNMTDQNVVAAPEQHMLGAPMPNIEMAPTYSQDEAIPTRDLGTANPPQPRQSMWKDVLMGALVGLAGGAGQKTFASGVGGGARATLSYQQQQVENQQRQQQLDMQQQENTARIKFMSAQSASLAADTALKDAHLHALPQQLQDEHTANALSQLKEMQALGLQPTLVVDNNKGGAEAKAGLEQLTDSHGAVPPMFTINLGNKIVGFDLNQLTQAAPILDTVNKIRQIQGLPAYTQQMWGQVPQQMKVQMTDKALSFWNPLPSEEALVQYKNYLNTAKAAPNSPDKAANVERLQGIVTSMQNGLDAMNKREAGQAANKAAAVATATVDAQAKALDANTPPSEVDPNSQSILSQTGLSLPAFNALVGNMSQLPRDKVSRQKAMGEAQQWANQHGVDVSTIASQYKAYNDVLSKNISRLNNTKIMEQELEGTIQNIQQVGNEGDLGKLRVGNVAKVFAGQEVNDPITQQYKMHLFQLRNELAAYAAAAQGRSGGDITVSDQKEAEQVIKDGIAKGGLNGLQTAVQNSTDKMGTVLQGSVDRSRKAIWDLFGVGNNYQHNAAPVSSHAPTTGGDWRSKSTRVK